MQEFPQHLVLVRHGQSAANAALKSETDALYYYDHSNSSSDREVPLTALGVRQVSECGSRLARVFPPEAPLQRILLSPYWRIRQTVDGIVHELAYKPEQAEDERLSKRNYGAFWNLTYKGLAELFPEEYARLVDEGLLSYRPPGGENYFDLFSRFADFYQHELAEATGNLLVATHSVGILALQRLLEGLPDEDVVRLYEGTALANGHMQIYERRAPDLPWQRCLLPDENEAVP